MPSFVNQLGKKDDTKQDPDQPQTKLPVSAYVGCAAQTIYGCGYGVMGVCMSLAAVEIGIPTSTVAAISGFGGVVSLIGGLSQHHAFIFGAILIAVTFVLILIYTIVYKEPEGEKASS